MIIFFLISVLIAVTYIFIEYFKDKPKKDNVHSESNPINSYNNEEKRLFLKNWTLLQFAKEFGPKMQIGEHSKDGKNYHDCRFIKKDGTETTVRFFSQLGELTKDEIQDRKTELFVGQMENMRYYLHGNTKGWKTVDLGIE